MNPAVVLSLIEDLYSQIGVLADENSQLRKALPEQTAQAEPPR